MSAKPVSSRDIVTRDGTAIRSTHGRLDTFEHGVSIFYGYIAVWNGHRYEREEKELLRLHSEKEIPADGNLIAVADFHMQRRIAAERAAASNRRAANTFRAP